MSQRAAQVAPAMQYNDKQYDRIRFLGKGSFGSAVVHRRRHDCSLVVLKEIDLKRFKGEREKWSAINEARIMSTLNHANIIKYHNAYTTETKLIIEMEYASMGSLAVYLSYQMQPLEEQEILVIYRQIVAGLDYLHSRNIIHLDLKMGNIFVTIEGLVKIGDFGISQYIDTQLNLSPQQRQPSPESQADETGARKSSILRAQQNSHRHRPAAATASSPHFGTLAYSSPERCLGESTDFKSDIWSLGCILYELITSEPLFAGNSLAELVLNITRIHYKPIKRNLSSQLCTIFEKSISRYPKDRPSAKDLLCATDQLLSKIQLLKHKVSKRQTHHSRFDLSTEVALLAAQNQDDMGQINYLHSLVYQVRLNAQNIKVDRVNLPQTKRIKEISKGRSHYLVLTYDNLVYGWGSKTCGQLGAFGLTSSSSNKWSRSARNSINASTNSFISTSDSQQQPQSMYTSSAASSLASSTQTLSTAAATMMAANKSAAYCGAQQQHLSKQVVMSMLEESKPTSRPFVINELNHRKIIQVAAGNNFSVFLSKTGIVMTCGDGSTGCLGRGDLRSCFTPSMVESLLNSDVVCVACGPKHVVAVCGNGRAFAWGKNRHGRLGIGVGRVGTSSSDLITQVSSGNENSISAKYILRPQPVLFDENVFVKSVFCGDKSTIFIDSNNRLWACGENRHNKLGFDIKRRFKRPLIVNNCFQPTEITTLSKYRIVACNIGKNHSTFISSENRLFVFGQDIDHTYRLKSNNICSRQSRQMISLELQPRHNQNRSRYPNIKASPYYSNTSYQQQVLNKQLNKSPENRMKGVRKALYKRNFSRESESGRIERKHLELFMKKSRASKKMSFESVVSVGCTSKFTLALTNDNRVYFWGTRSYSRDDSSSNAKLTRRLKKSGKKEISVEPQLVPSSADECFIKIGGTNSSLMSNIQTSGSDQPIIQAQDPRLKANSLSDLWILDYKPSYSTSGDESATSSSSMSSVGGCSLSCMMGEKQSSLSGSSCSLCCNQSSCVSEDLSDEEDSIKNDAILEPQPIISLYVPSMFNHNDCSLHIVDLFCFDEDRFYLILDTTIKLQHSSNSSRPLTSTSITSTYPSHSSPRNTIRSSPHSPQKTSNCKNADTKQSSKVEKSPNCLIYSDTQVESLKIKMGDGLIPKDKFATNSQHKQKKCKSQERQVGDNRSSEFTPAIAITTSLTNKLTVLNESAESAILSASLPNRLANKEINEHLQAPAPIQYSAETLGKSLSSFDGNNNNLDHSNTIMSFSQGCASMEEPRSISTFATSLGNQIILGPSMRTLEAPLEPLLFTNSDQNGADGKDNINEPHIYHNENSLKTRGRNNKSESNTTNLDETSSMPSWVKNEYIQQCQQLNSNNLLSDEEALQNDEYGMFALDSSTTDQDNNNFFITGLDEIYLDACDNLTIKAASMKPSAGSLLNQRKQNEAIDGASLSIVTSRLNSANTSLNHETFILNFDDELLATSKRDSNKTSTRAVRSKSQPDISEKINHEYLDEPDLQNNARVARRASIIVNADTTRTRIGDATNELSTPGGYHTSQANLLHCGIYRAGAANATDARSSRTLNYSALSSCTTSNNPLVSSVHINRFSLQSTHQLTRATINGSPSLEVAEFHELATLNAEEATLHWARVGGSRNLYTEQQQHQLVKSGSSDQLGRLNVHTRSKQESKKRGSLINIKSKTVSSSSMASLCRSFVKLFC